MIEVVSIKFKNRGKAYSFDPRNLRIKAGDKVVIETSKGLELADCSQGNHSVEESSVVRPLRPVVRLATAADLRVAEINARRETEAKEICREKIAEHGLEMKLVDAECSFEGNKLTFFFTSEGRVDFRDLVKELAGIFRTRIELRQIGVRDEAKMLGGIAICGRPYCCGQFLEDFEPVSTKMAKVQSLSLNPAKISGSCGRLMCCLRYEQEAYEDLVKKVPKQGAFVETKDGYGTAVQVNLLRQTVKVRLDGDSDDTLHLFKANELAAVPGGRPRDGEQPLHVLNYVPQPEEDEEREEDEWTLPALYAADVPEQGEDDEKDEKKRARRRRSRSKAKSGEPGEQREETAQSRPGEQEKSGRRSAPKKERDRKGGEKKDSGKRAQGEKEKNSVKPVRQEPDPAGGEARKKEGRPRHRRGGRRGGAKPKEE